MPRDKIDADTGKFYEESNIQHKFADESMQPKSIRDFFKIESKFLEDNIPKKSFVLDAGCGWGRHLSLISDKISRGIGIDLDKKRISESKQFLKDKKNIETLHADIYDIPFPEGYFDIVICMNNTFGNLNKHRLALKEMIRVLKTKGKLILSVHSGNIAKDKLDWYKKIGLKNPRFNGEFILTDEGFYSYCFKENYLSNLFHQFKNISFTIENLTPYSYLCTIQKNQSN